MLTMHPPLFLIAAAGATFFGFLGFDHGDVALIVVALIQAAAVVLAAGNHRRLRALERQARKRRVVAIRRPENGFEGPAGTVYDEDDDD